MRCTSGTVRDESSSGDTRVRVYVRARPLTNRDDRYKTPLEYESDTKLRVKDRKQDDVYSFDHVFSAAASNGQVCDVVCQPLIDTVLSGFNGSFMVYGQTGTGKTYTVLSDDGLIQQTIDKLFATIKRDPSSTYTVTLSYLQIYQDRIHDLLDPSKGGGLVMREHPTEGVVIESLREEVIINTNEGQQLLNYGQKQLIVAETKMGRMSSRYVFFVASIVFLS